MKNGQIKLSEIAPSGESFDYDLSSSSFAQPLKRDFDGLELFEGRFHIQPLDQIFQLTGQIQVRFHETCSRCGDDMVMALEIPVRELIQISLPQERSSSYAKANNFSDIEETQSTLTEIPDEVLNLPELTHELIAIRVPHQPMCAHSTPNAGQGPFPSGDGYFDRCAVYGDQPVNFDEEMENAEEREARNPFSSLKSLLKN